MRRDAIDFAAVAPEHRAIDVRLEAWARWVKGGRRVGGVCAPMFRLYRPSYAGSIEPRAAAATPDELDALALEHAVSQLPERPREALRWCYVTPWVSPIRLSRYLAVRVSDVPGLLHEARALLVSARA